METMVSMKVPLLDLKAQYAPIRGELLEAVTRVCDSQRFILGPEVEALERMLGDRLGVAHAIGVSSGTDALLVSLMACGIGPGDEVVTTTYSFFATAGCVTRLGATPVLVDIDPETYGMNLDALPAALTPKTRAIVPVHLYGLPVDVARVNAVASERGIPVIEDAAQAIGAERGGRTAGSMGTVGCFSFFPSKNLGAFGDGGLVTTSDDELGARVRRLRHHGQAGEYRHLDVGGNFRLDEMQAAVLQVKARYLQGWAEARRRNAARYRRLFADAGLEAAVGLPSEPADVFHVYNQFVVRVPKRDALREHLETRGVGSSVYYPIPFHLQPCFAHLGYAPGSFPEAERAANETLALPVYPELTEEQQAYVVRCIGEFV